jgi:hypothetical protein
MVTRGRSPRIASRAAAIAAALLLVLLLSGCPLVTEHPLSDPAQAVLDRALAGAWTMDDPDADEKGVLFFYPFNEREYVVVGRGEKTGKIEAYRAFTTEVAGERFLNARELEATANSGNGRESSGWYILGYRIDGSKLVMRPVDDELLGGRAIAGSADLLDFVRSNIANPALFGSGDRGGLYFSRDPRLSSDQNAER